jgi:hypothetical protein
MKNKYIFFILYYPAFFINVSLLNILAEIADIANGFSNPDYN